MTVIEAKPRRRRLRNGRRWPKWLRDPRLLKWAFIVGLYIWRLWRLWKELTSSLDG
jgi:hypothetical protein